MLPIAVDSVLEYRQHQPPFALYCSASAKCRKVLIRQKNIGLEEPRSCTAFRFLSP